MNIVEVRKIVGQLKAQLFKKSNSYSIGMLKSHFRGSGLQFKEHRQYTHGDDVRFIDWKILAKTGDPFIKTFEEERNVHIAVLIDLNPSMFYGWDGVSKIQAALEITCLLYLLAAETSDYVHAILLADEVVDIPIANGEKGISQFIAYLAKVGLINEDGEINYNFQQSRGLLEEREREIKKHIARNRELIILSDWLNFLPESSFKNVTYNKNVHSFRILAPLDYAQKRPISLLTSNYRKAGVKVIHSGKKKQPKDVGMIKDLKVDERYLDNFIREMI